MDFADRILELSKRVQKQIDHLATEEATKTALVMPFINALGYDVFNPQEVIPEFCADHGVKKGEKVDYALCKDGSLVMLWECKPVGTDLDHVGLSQLYRYFSVTEARIAVLTDGVIYRFFTDLEAPNKMDNKAFLEINLQHPKDALIAELKKISKTNFDQESVLATAGELKYTNEMKRVLAAQLSEPDEDFIEILTRSVYSGRLTQSIKDQFRPTVRRAFRDFINDQITARLESAMTNTGFEGEANNKEADGHGSGDSNGNGIVTTQDEIEGYHIVKAILREDVAPERIAYRDVKSYFGILLDDNNRKPICRLHFNTSSWYIGLFDSEDRAESRETIESLNHIYRYADRLKATLKHYTEDKDG